MRLPRMTLRPLVTFWQWQREAECRSMDSDLFFPREGERYRSWTRRARLAKAICSTCPVKVECRTHALSSGEGHGVWGGLLEQERQEFVSGRTPVDQKRTPLRIKPGPRPPGASMGRYPD
ncbi:WhiB family transcriptional regulator [Rhodococcus sp. WS4]|nr:WhiB family transcriptional regulator [Rhodococcus sp. WS4]